MTKYFLVGFFLLSGCKSKSFYIYGTKLYCLINYNTNKINCVYEERRNCENELGNGVPNFCFPREYLKKHIKS